MGKTARIEDLDDPAFDPTVETGIFPDFSGDPFTTMRAIIGRGGEVQEGSIHSLVVPGATFHDPLRRHFAVLGASAARTVLGNAELFSQEAYAPDVRRTFGNAINQMEPPVHTRYRRVLQKVFLPHIVATWSDNLVQPVIDALIIDMKRSDRAELISQFTHRYPFQIIFRQLNLPPEDIKIFQKLAETLGLRTADMLIPMEASRKLGIYLETLIEERRRNPGDDLISQLIQAEAEGERLPDDIIISFFRQLLNAAGDTTYRATGNLFVGLLRDRPEQYRQLLHDRSQIPKAVEEVMRWNGPIIAIHRMAMRDTELAGVHIPAGSFLEVNYSSLGHDAAVHEQPDAYDMTRAEPKRHMGFGYGIHVCIGQHLARLEMTRALDAMLDHFPQMRLDPDFPPPVICGWGLRSPDAIHVILD